MSVENNQRLVYDGKIFKIYQKEVVDKDGFTHTIEQCSRPNIVSVIGLHNDGVVLIHEFRSGESKHVYWLPGGKIESGEQPETTARREFEEETGYSAAQYSLFHHKYPSDSFINNGYTFLASGISKISQPHTSGDETGNISTEIVELNRAIEMTFTGEMPNEFFGYLLLKLRLNL